MARDWDIVSRTWPRSECFRWGGWRDFIRLGLAASRSDLVFCWFGAAHALAAVLVCVGRRPVVVVAGGWDAAKLPEIGYGAHSSYWLPHASRFLFRRARRVLAVSDFTRGEAIRHTGVKPERLATVYHGFDPASWPEVTGSRPLDVVTVSGTHSLVKGIDLVIDTALRAGDLRFEVVGPRPGRELHTHMLNLPPNLSFTGPLSGDAFKAKLQSAKVCFQPSRQESFGCAVAEAMLCGCIPVVSNRGALPEVLGDVGHLVDWMLPQEFETSIRKALSATDADRCRARNRIVETFHLDAYARRLVGLLSEML